MISGPRTDIAGLDELAPLWKELHGHHLRVSSYAPLVADVEVSWERRRKWYRQLLNEGAAYLTATSNGQIVGYAMLAFAEQPDDTFETARGVPELLTLVVAEERRSAGVGRALLDAAEGLARERGFNAMKIAVMAGNERARRFYEAGGYQLAELLLYRRLA